MPTSTHGSPTHDHPTKSAILRGPRMSTALAYEPAQPEEATAAGRPSLTALIRAQPRILFAAGLLLVLTLAAVLAPLIGGHDPVATDPDHALVGPGPGHWFGT